MSELDIKEKKKRLLINLLCLHIGLLILGFFFLLALLWPALPIRPICYLKKYLHLYCPGCGATRAFLSLLQGKFLQSIFYNPLLLALIGLLAFYDISLIQSVFTKKTPFCTTPLFQKCQNRLAILFSILVLFYFIFRNAMLIFFQIDPLGDLIPYSV